MGVLTDFSISESIGVVMMLLGGEGPIAIEADAGKGGKGKKGNVIVRRGTHENQKHLSFLVETSLGGALGSGK